MFTAMHTATEQAATGAPAALLVVAAFTAMVFLVSPAIRTALGVIAKLAEAALAIGATVIAGFVVAIVLFVAYTVAMLSRIMPG